MYDLSEILLEISKQADHADAHMDAAMKVQYKVKVNAPPPSLYIGLGQREAWVVHELLFNHA